MKKLKFFLSLLMLFTFSIGTMWGTKITSVDDIVSGEKYYIGATKSDDSDWYLSVADHGELAATGKQGTAVSSKDEADVFTFTKSGDNWTIKFESGNYMSLADSKANGKVNVEGSAANWTITDVDGKGLMNFAINGYCLQRNSSTSLNFGSYASGQLDLWLEAASSGPTVKAVDDDTSDPLDAIDLGDVGTSWTDVTSTFALSCKNLTAGTLTLTVPSTFEFVDTDDQTKSITIASDGDARFGSISIRKNTTTAADIDDYLTVTGGGLASAVNIPLKMNVHAPEVTVTKGGSPISLVDFGSYRRYSFNNIVRDTIKVTGQYLPKYQQMMIKYNDGFQFQAATLDNSDRFHTNTDGTLDLDVMIKGYTDQTVGLHEYVDDDSENPKSKIYLEDTWVTGEAIASVNCKINILSSKYIRFNTGSDDNGFQIKVYDSSDKLQDSTIVNYDINAYFADETDLIVATPVPAPGYSFTGWGYTGYESKVEVITELNSQLRLHALESGVFISGTFTQTCTPLAAPEEVSGYPTTEWYMGAYKTIIKWNEVANASGYTLNVHNVADGASHSRDFDRNQDDMVFADGTVSCEITGLDGDAEYEYTIMAKGSGSYCTENYTTVNTLSTPDWPTVTLTLIENGDEHEVTYPFNETYTLPSTSSAGCLGKVLVGWTRWSVATQASDVHFAPGEEFDNPFYVLDPTLSAVYAVDESAWNVATSIAAGDKVVISTNSAYDGDMKTAGAISSQLFGLTESTYNGDTSKITALADGTTQLIVDGNSTDGWTLQDSDDNYLIISGDKKVNWSVLNDFHWDISFDGNVATVKGKDDYTSYSLQYNYNNGDNPRFTAYSSSQTPISLYKYVPAYSDYSTTCNGLDNSLNVTFSVPEGAYTEAKNVTLGSLSGTTIYYTLDGSDPSSSATRSTYTAPVALSTSGTYTIKAFAISSTAHSSVTQATYTINIPLTTMDQIFARAKQVGGTPTDVNVTFDNWVVTGKTSNNAYLTDGTKGLIIYANSHGFNVGDKLSGTAACKVQLYKGASELTNLTSSTTGLTVTTGGVITPVEKAITALDSINTGAPIIVTEVTYNGTNLVDVSSNSIKPYNKLYSEMSFTSGKKYNVTGLYCQFEDTKQIMPRSAADIVEVKESAELAWSAASATVTYGAGDNEFPSLTNPHSVTVAYSSTNTAVATIESNGAITLLKAGETTIKATLSGDATYADAEVSYTLTVNKGDAELAWSAASATVKIGADDNVFPTLSNPHSVSVSYSCSHTSLATIDSEGVITLIEGGGVDATITATLSGDDKYADAVVSYTLTIKRGDPALAWKISDATVDAATVTIEAGDNVFPTLYNPHNLPVTYSSSKTDTATINSSTGAISLVGAGKTTITASFAGSGAYNSGSASYTLTVNPAVKPASAFTWTAASKTTEFTSSSAGLLPKIQNLENTIDTALIQFTSSDATVAEPRRPYYENSTWLVPINFKKPGTVTISAVFAGNDDYSGKTVAYELTITKGKCPIYWNNETGSATFFNNSTNYATLRGTDYYDGIDVVYSSSNENVATIDASTGVITQVAAGTCEIRATSDDERFRDTTVAYTLTLNKANLGSALEWTNGVADAGSLTIYGGDASWSVPSFHINSLTMYSVEDDIVLTSSNTDVATVTPGQKYVDLTAVGGTTTVTASVPANHPKVNETSITYTLTFVPQVSLYSAFNSWSSTDYMTNSGDYTSASKTYSLTTGTTYIFRVKANGTWYSDDAATLTRASNSVSDVKVANSEYLRITPDKDGDYTFTWNYATKSLTVEYPEHIPAGVIEVTPTSIDFGSAKKGTTSKHPVTGDDVQNLYRDVTITASNLTADIELEATQNGGGALFGVSEYVIYQSAGVINKTVQVRLSTNYVGTFNGKLTITSKAALVDFEPIVINLTGVIEDTATGVEDVETEGQAVKRLINGQLFIIRGEKMYDAQGKLVK